MSGASGERLELATASPVSLPACTCGSGSRITLKAIETSPEQRGGRGRRALVGNMHQIDSRHPLQLLGSQMLWTAVAVGCVAEFPRVGLGVLDQLRDRLHRNLGVR